MDIASVLIPRLAAIAFAVLVAIMQIVGLALGIASLRQALGARSAARIGIVLNGGGVFCTVIVMVLLLSLL